MEQQSPVNPEFGFGRLNSSPEDQGNPQFGLMDTKIVSKEEAVTTLINSVEGPAGSSLGCNGEFDNCSPKHLQDIGSIKPKGKDEEKGYFRSDEVGIKNTISEQLDNNIIAQGKNTEPVSPSSSETTPLLTRINRLDIVLDYLEDKNLSSESTSTPPRINMESATLEMDSSDKRLEERCKPMRWLLEETEAKGTIVERIAALEDRVNKLREEIELKNGAESRMHMHLNICEVGGMPCEGSRKGLHEEVSRRLLHVLDIPKDNNWQPMAMDTKGKNNDMTEDEEIQMIEKEKSVSIDGKNKTREGKGKLRRMFSGCIFPRSH